MELYPDVKHGNGPLSKPRRRIIRREEVSRRTGLPKSSLYALMSKDMFPERVRLGPRAVGWYEDDVDHWIDTRESRGAQ